MFKNKIYEIDNLNESIWISQLENVESIHVESYLKSLEEEKLKIDTKEMGKKIYNHLHLNQIEQNIKKLRSILNENNKSIIWYFKKSPIEPRNEFVKCPTKRFSNDFTD